MPKIDLARFLAESAGELLDCVDGATPAAARLMLDEAEELLALGAAVLARLDAGVDLREAA